MSETLFSPASEPAEVLAHLDPLLKRVERGFSKSIPLASSFFEEQSQPIERSLFAGIVRWHLKRYLRDQGVSVDLEVPFGYELDDVANIGLIVNCEGFQIRILKARDSKIPVSNSDLRKSFYQHNLEFGEGSLIPSTVLNLVVLWETDYESGVALSVACPKREQSGTVEGRRKVECFWQLPITAPVAVLDSVQFDSPVVSDSDLEEVVLLEEEVDEKSQEKITIVRTRAAAKD